MALITCKECGGTVSDTAASCPHCGYVMSSQDNHVTQENVSKDWIPVVAFLGLMVAVLVFVIVMAVSVQKSQREAFNKSIQDALTDENGTSLEDFMNDTEEKVRDVAR